GTRIEDDRGGGEDPGVTMMLDSDLGAVCHCLTRRRFLQRTSAGLGVAALASLLGEPSVAAAAKDGVKVPGVLGKTHFAPKVKNVIYLFMAGGPSHVDLFDPKPKLQELHGKEMPKSVLGEQRVTLMTRNQGAFKTASTPFKANRHGKSGIEMTTVLPHLATVADDLCVIR